MGDTEKTKSLAGRRCWKKPPSVLYACLLQSLKEFIPRICSLVLKRLWLIKPNLGARIKIGGILEGSLVAVSVLWVRTPGKQVPGGLPGVLSSQINGSYRKEDLVRTCSSS